MSSIIDINPVATQREASFFRFTSAREILNGDGGARLAPPDPRSEPDRAEEREPGTRKDGEAMPPDSLDPKKGEGQPPDVEGGDSTATTPPGRPRNERTTL